MERLLPVIRAALGFVAAAALSDREPLRGPSEIRAPRPIAPTSLPAASRGPDEGRAGRIEISEDPAGAARARVVGSLTRDSVPVLLDAVDRGVVVLDLSGLHQVDDSGVSLLARLSPTRCTLVASPGQLKLRLGRVRCNAEF